MESSGSDLIAVPGSAAVPHPGEEPAGRPDPTEPMTVTVYLRLPELGSDEVPSAPGRPAPGVVEAVTRYARSGGLTVQPAPGPETVRLAGPAAAMERCFGVRLARWRTAEGTTGVAPEGEVHVPRAVARDVVAVLGLDTRPIARPHA